MTKSVQPAPHSSTYEFGPTIGSNLLFGKLILPSYSKTIDDSSFALIYMYMYGATFLSISPRTIRFEIGPQLDLYVIHD